MARRELRATYLLEDIRSGMGMSELMEKHGVSSNSLKGAVSILLDTQAITREELYGELHSLFDTVVPDNTRELVRHQLDFDTLIYDPSRPEIYGKVLDITEAGVRLVGIEAKLDETKSFVILGDAFGDVAPIEFEAVCRWAEPAKDGGECVTGFQITKISEKDSQELQEMIHLLESEL